MSAVIFLNILKKKIMMMTKKNDENKIETTSATELKSLKDLIGKTVQPDWTIDEHNHHAVSDEETGDEHNMKGLTSVRRFKYQGRNVVINTTYEIKIDNQPYMGHAGVDSMGRIHCHAIPYDTYASAVDFVKQLIGLYPESFPKEENGTDDNYKTKKEGGKHHDSI